MLTKVKALYQAGNDFMPALEHLYAWDSQGLQKASEQDSDPWWGLMYRHLARKMTNNDLKKVCNLLDDSSPYDILLQKLLFKMLQHHDRYDKEALICALKLIQKRPLPELFKRENIYYVGLFNNFKNGIFYYNLAFGPTLEAMMTFYERHHWMNYISTLVKEYIRTDKKQLNRLIVGVYNQTDFQKKMKHLKTIFDSFEPEFFAKAWADSTGAYRYFYFILQHGKEPEKQSVSTNYFKEELYNKFKVSYNNKSRVEGLFQHIDTQLVHTHLEEELYKIIMHDKTLHQSEEALFL